MSQIAIANRFQKVAEPPRGKKRASPFCIRLTQDERAYLEELAGTQPLGSYIRKSLLGKRAEKRKTYRKPKINDAQLGQILAELGRSRYSSNLNQIAKSANMGTLDVSRDVEQELLEACGAVLAMRDALITALGLNS